MKLLALSSILLATSVFAGPCGLTGTVEERIKDCATVKGDFVLVTVTEKGQEFYKDAKSGLIWGGRIPADYNHYGSSKACADDVYGALKLKWRLPTIPEFEQASFHGMKTVLPDMNHSYWSSTPVKTRRKARRRRNAPPASSYIWDGIADKTDTGDLRDGASVRCVAKES